MTKHRVVATALILALCSAPAAKAQVTIDVAKITCDQFLLFKVTDPRHIAIWISGFYHGKSGSTVIDVQALKNSADKVQNYCRSNIKLTVMQAVDALFGPPK